MSLESWKAECYPIPADQTEESEAGAHSLRKWEGALPAMLEKHGVMYSGTYILAKGEEDLDNFAFTSEDCSLCHHYFDADLNLSDYVGDDLSSYAKYHQDQCRNCPLAIVRGGIPCDNRREDEDESPYHSSPEVMVKWLRLAVQWEKEHVK